MVKLASHVRSAVALRWHRWPSLVVGIALWLPLKAIAGLIEYALILTLVNALIIVLGNEAPSTPNLLTQLQVTVEGARAANMTGNQIGDSRA